tara:strand:+ start:453 stop:1901 length:1449 start_codon:yes stop_codon:yes gene_type:complete
MALDSTPGFDLQPSGQQVALSTNYITDFNFLNQYLPDTYEKEFERYGDRSVSSFLRMVGAELPSSSDMIKWAEQGRLHTKYTGCVSTGATVGDATAIWLIPSAQVNPAAPASSAPAAGFTAIRVGQTIMISDETALSTLSNKAIVTAVATTADTGTYAVTVAYYDQAGQSMVAAANCTIFIYGSEFKKGTDGMQGSIEAQDFIFDNSPIIIKDTYTINGSDMAQVGWIEVATENGGTGYLWYLKSKHETRLRFEDYLETSMVEAVPATVGGTGSGAATAGFKGSDGVLYSVNNRGNVWSGGNPVTLAGFDAVVQRLDKQGAIEENVIFANRQFTFDIDDMLAEQSSNAAGGVSYGLFDNDKDMSLNLGFTGFRRGYDFYKSDWKYLNDATMRGGLTGGAVNGLLVPAGSTTVYDQVLGKNAKRPFLHVRYRASEAEDRRYKTWVTGGAGGAKTSSVDAMTVDFLSERCVCTLGANNFFLFKD